MEPPVTQPSPEELVRSQVDRVYRLCSRLVANTDDAEECAQQSLLRALERLPSFRGRSELSTWVYRITVNVCRNFGRRDRLMRQRHLYGRITTAEDSLPLASRYESPEQVLSRVESDAAVTRAIRSLPYRQRAAVVLREMEGMSYSEIARTLRMPAGTVRSTLYRARRTLAHALEGVRP